MPNIKLKPCPFCGNQTSVGVFDENFIEIRDIENCVENPYFAVCCSVNDYGTETPNYTNGCGAMGGFKPTKKEAIENWNQRT